jgi:hypothetical protein
MPISLPRRQGLAPRAPHQRRHLTPRRIDRPRSVDQIVGHGFLALERHLRGDALFGFGAPHAAPAGVIGQPHDLLLGPAPHHHQPIEMRVVTRFDQKRRRQHRDTCRIGCGDALKFLVGDFEHARVHDPVQHFKPRRIAKHDARQRRAIHVAIGAQNAGAEFAHHFLVRDLARIDQIVRDIVRFQNVTSQRAHHRRHGAFPAGDSSRQSHAQH